MSKTARDLVKNVIEENALDFKKNVGSVLYNKVGNALSNKYVEMSKSLFSTNANQAETKKAE